MTDNTEVSRVDAIAHVLDERVGSLQEIGPARWNISRSNGAGLRIEGRVEDEWVTLRSGFPAGRGQPSNATVWRLLEASGGLPGGVKFSWLPRKRELLAGVEIPLDDDEADIGTRLAEACAGMEAAAALQPGLLKSWKQEADGRGAGERPADAGEPKAEAPSGLSQLCAEAGWECTERPGGDLAVTLEVPGGFHQAMLREIAGGRVAVATQLAPCESSTPLLCRHALGLLLLRVSGVIRMARAAAHGLAVGMAPRLEVVFDSSPSASELRHALCALSTACRLCGQEAELLQADEKIAREYVARWRWPPGIERRCEREAKETRASNS